MSYQSGYQFSRFSTDEKKTSKWSVKVITSHLVRCCYAPYFRVTCARHRRRTTRKRLTDWIRSWGISSKIFWNSPRIVMIFWVPEEKGIWNMLQPKTPDHKMAIESTLVTDTRRMTVEIAWDFSNHARTLKRKHNKAIKSRCSGNTHIKYVPGSHFIL